MIFTLSFTNMITTKEILQSITSFSTYFKSLLFLGFIWFVSKLFSNLIDIPIQLIALPIFIIIVVIGTYLATYPLFIDYKYVLGKLSEIARISIAEFKKEQAKCKDIESELEYLQGLYKTSQANYNNLQAILMQNKKIISELQNENSELKVSDSLELANTKEELSKAKGYLESMSKELLAKTNKLKDFQHTEKFMFLVELDLSPTKVAGAVTNIVNAKNYQNQEQKQQMINLLNKIKQQATQ